MRERGALLSQKNLNERELFKSNRPWGAKGGGGGGERAGRKKKS